MAEFLGDYKVIETLAETSSNDVYRVEKDGKKYIFKMLASGVSPLFGNQRLRKEYNICKRLFKLEPKYFLSPVEFHQSGSVGIVWEDTGLVSLKAFALSASISIKVFFEIAQQMLLSIHHLHAAGIIHRDISPRNFLINPKTLRVFLSDFGSSSYWREFEENMIQTKTGYPSCGTYQYMSPEHTGKVNRAIDYRSDIYSLGIVFYELLCGKPPLRGISNRLAVLFAHVALDFPPLHVLVSCHSKVPLALSNIISKMVKKDPEQRYQSSLGLLFDLERAKQFLDVFSSDTTELISLDTHFQFDEDEEDTEDSLSKQLAQLQLVQSIQQSKKSPEIADYPFELGTKDRTSVLKPLKSIFGRDRELRNMVNLVAASLSSPTPNGALVLVGYSGSGKTILINKALQEIVLLPKIKDNYLLVTIKFQQYSTTISILFLEMLRGLREMLDDELELTNQIQNSLGDDISALAELFTELRVFVPAGVSSAPQDTIDNKVALKRATGKWMALVTRILQKEFLMIFIDDLKPNDDNNIIMIYDLFELTEIPIFFFFGLRDGETETKTVDLISSVKSIHRIVLSPLNVTDVSRIIAEMLGAKPAEIIKLAELLNRKTKGNPFFISQIITQLYTDEHLKFNFEKQTWRYNLKKIESLHCTTNVVDLLIKEIQKLSKPCRKLLECASSVGSFFSVDLLSKLAEIPTERTLRLLGEAKQHGFVQPKYMNRDISEVSGQLAGLSGSGASIGSLNSGNLSSLSGGFSANMFTNRISPGSVGSFSEGSHSGRNSSVTGGVHSYCFHHDRVREGFYQLLSPGRKKCFHYHIGKIMMNELDLSSVDSHKTLDGGDSDDEEEEKEIDIEAVSNIQEGAFLAVIRHLAIGQDLISTVPESLEVFDFFCAGAKLCQNLGNFVDALSHIQRAHNLLFYWFGEYSAWDDEYQRTKNLFKSITEIKAVCSSTEDTTLDFEMIYRFVTDDYDRLDFYVIQAYYFSNTQQYSQVVSLVIQVMEEKGFKLDVQASLNSTLEQITILRSQYDENTVKLSQVGIFEDKKADLLISFINETIMPLYLSSSIPLLCQVISIAISLILTNGLGSSSGSCVSALGFVIHMTLGPCKEAEGYSKLGVSISERMNIPDDKKAQSFFFAGVCDFYSSKITDIKYKLTKASHYSNQASDISVLSYSKAFASLFQIFFSKDLQQFVKSLKNNLQMIRSKSKTCRTDILVVLWSMYKACYVLVEGNPPEKFLDNISIHYSEQKDFDELPELSQFAARFYQMISLFYQNEISEALNHLSAVESFASSHIGLPMSIDALFYCPLLRIRAGQDNKIILPFVTNSIEKLQRYTSQSSVSSRIRILEAEKMRLEGSDSMKILERLDSAYLLALDHKSYNIAAIAAEQSRNCLLQNKVQLGLSEAVEKANKMYRKWGARAISSVVKKPSRRGSAELSSSTVSRGRDVSVHNMVLNHVTEILTNERSTSECISVFCKIILQHAGADVGFIFYKHKDAQIYLLAEWNNQGIMEVHPLPTISKGRDAVPSSRVSSRIPFRVVTTVLRTGETITSLEKFSDVPNTIGSICCVPMKNGSSVLGAVYLENTLMKGAFPIQHQTLLEHLACQIVSIIERNELNRNLKKTIRKVEKRAQLLESLNKMKDDFVASTSHELRTPLNAIIGFTEILRETKLTSDQAECCEMVYASAEGLLAVINDILDFQRCQQDSIRIEASSFDFRKLLDHVLRLLLVKLAPGVDLVLDIDTSLPLNLWMICDRLRLQQIFLNLLSNAIKFTTEGSVRLRVCVESRPEILNYYRETDGKLNSVVLYVCVEDTGIGIDESQRSNLFKPFSQLDSGPTRKYMGTGLGLIITQNLVRILSDGKSEIEFESEVGRGTKFFFNVPVTLTQPENPDEKEIAKRNNSLQLLENCAVIVFIPSPLVRNFLLYEINIVKTSTIRVVNSLEEILVAVKEIASVSQNLSKHIICYVDPPLDTQNEALISFASDLKPFGVYLFLVCSFTAREQYHLLLSSTQASVNIIPKPFYKDLIINNTAAAIHHFLVEQEENRKNSADDAPVSLPLNLVSENETKSLVVSPKKQDKGENDAVTILMVEDNKMNQKVQTRILKMIGIECEIASNGQEGVLMYQKKMERGEFYPLIIMDFHMPIMDGKEATKEIRKLETQHNVTPTHIIGLTADPEGHSNGMCVVLAKPIKKDSFSKNIKEFLTSECACISSSNVVGQ